MARPSTPLLSVEGIAGAALTLVDRTGGFTVAELARSLGVRPSSLYHHVAGRTEVVEAMRTLVFAELDPPLPTGEEPWQEALPRLLRGYRDAFARHPRLIPMLTAQTVAAPGVLRMYGDLAVMLTRSGIPVERVLDAITILDSYVIGAALDVAAPEQVWDAGEVGHEELRRAIAHAPSGRERADQTFEIGLQVLLAGLGTLRR